MSDAERQRRRHRRVLLDAAAVLAVPVTLVLLAAVVALAVFLQREIDADDREDRALARILVRERQQTTYLLCVNARQNRAVIRRILIRARDARLARGGPGADAARRFYNPLLAGLPEIVCVRPGGRPKRVRPDRPKPASPADATTTVPG